MSPCLLLRNMNEGEGLKVQGYYYDLLSFVNIACNLSS